MGAMGSSVVMLPPPRPKIQPDDPLSAPNLPVEPTAVESDLPQIVAPPVVALQDKLPAFAEPSFSATQAPIVLSSGATIQPLTRLRNEHDFDWILFKTDQGFWWSPAEFFVTVAPALPPEQASVPYEIGHEPVDRDTPLPPNYVPPDLVPIPAKFCLGMKEIRLRREVVEALVRMLEAAESQGLHIRAFSGFRDFETQRRLYLEAVEKQGPKQNGTAAPGYSEHQLGTTVDVSNLDPQYVLSSRFGETPEGRWLFQHAAEFGFVHSYTNENTQEVGYKPEPWHLRYLGQTLARETVVARSARGGGASPQ
jgi:LAS superfamily LD-carboxypeptidase LdcB